jgi:hypothetical protein
VNTQTWRPQMLLGLKMSDALRTGIIATTVGGLLVIVITAVLGKLGTR